MSSDNLRIPDEIAQEVLDLASRYYEDYKDSYSAADLVEIGGQVSIPAELIQKAIAEIEQQKRQEQLAKKKKATQQQLYKRIGIGAVVISGLWAIFTFNHLNSAKSNVKAALAQVENQQQRRTELIPDLVNITKTFANQEERILTQLISARESYLVAQTPTEKSQAIAAVNNAISEFTQFSAQNPELANNQLFINLQYELAGTANRLAVERKRYNEAIQDYEQVTQSFPNVLIAKVAGFNAAEFSTNNQ
ncbi:LemA family protein [[Leptolyngbya] sp. PCC 7376]|uniref:LemA family protein n=1 Tax=[Leptolyngbya] sp. PCC 7376 TaxID=111781 RepID=UPI00029F1182|nr:LemA family protein [[Leptolyngbya] sp. PCC 7376]AFY37007.1 LemA family protein [[Leptolyngbya] sp. PCC 7376]